MRRATPWLIAAAAACLATSQPAAAVVAQDRHNVVLITLDGARVQEIFGGLDVEVLTSTLPKSARVQDQATYKRYWAATPEARREKLMPFFWGTLMREYGSIAGHRGKGSTVGVANRHWFSYPGYSEMLVGRADDDRIKSNDPIQNPHPTVLEYLRRAVGRSADDVALFGSWGVFNAIGESVPGAVTINAGLEVYDSTEAEVRHLSALQFETPTPWSGIRHDAYTFRLAMTHLAAHKPRVLYLAFDETDDWAHDKRYDRLLEAYSRTDEYLMALWTWLQLQPEYRGRTSLLITTDHGRGVTTSDWSDHGDSTPGAGVTWMAFVSPHAAARGEWTTHVPITTSQVASTLVTWMGLDWRAFSAAAAPPITFRK